LYLTSKKSIRTADRYSPFSQAVYIYPTGYSTDGRGTLRLHNQI